MLVCVWRASNVCRQKPLSVKCGIGSVEHDDEGRVVTVVSVVAAPVCWFVLSAHPWSCRTARKVVCKRALKRLWAWPAAGAVPGACSKGSPQAHTGLVTSQSAQRTAFRLVYTLVLQELPEVWLVNVYTPNSGEGLKRLDYRVQQWDKALAAFIKVGPPACVGKSLLDSVCGRQQGRTQTQRVVTAPALLSVLHLCADSLLHCAGVVCCQGLRSNGKPVVVLGDLNCAHQEIDVYAPKKFTRTAGFTQVGPDERLRTGHACTEQGAVRDRGAGSVQVTLQLAWCMLRLLSQTCPLVHVLPCPAGRAGLLWV